MRSYISKSMMLGLAMVAVAGCSSDSNKSSDLGGGTIKMNLALPDGVQITNPVHYKISCTNAVPSAVQQGDWPLTAPTNGNTNLMASGSIGGLTIGDSCTLTLSDQDAWGAANGNVTNCNATATATVSTGAGTLVSVNMVCMDGSTPVGPSHSGHVSQVVTLTSQGGTPHVCTSILWYSATPVEVNLGGTIALNSDLSNHTYSTSIAWTSSDSFGTFSTPATYGTNFVCNSAGSQTITLTVHDDTTGLLDASGNPTSCPSDSDTFSIKCDAPLTGTGGAATGGAATGGAATGGAVTGGAATGGAATGGAQVVLPATDNDVFTNKSAACNTCANANCSDVVGANGCEYLPWGAIPGQTTSTSTYAASAADAKFSISVGTQITGQKACVEVLDCVFANGCYNVANGNAFNCFCGTGADPGKCANGSVAPTGQCVAQFDNGFNAAGATAAGLYQSSATDYNYPAGLADLELQCLAQKCTAACFQ